MQPCINLDLGQKKNYCQDSLALTAIHCSSFSKSKQEFDRWYRLIKVAMSSFRSLAPSHQHDQLSGSSPTKQGAFVGESSTSGGTSGGASGSGGDSHRRRRNAGNVSLMACNECRHARQKVRSFIFKGSCLSMLRFV